jgi:hypothetical protein
MKNPPCPLFQRGVLKSPFGKGEFRGIWVFTVKLIPGQDRHNIIWNETQNFMSMPCFPGEGLKLRGGSDGISHHCGGGFSGAF